MLKRLTALALFSALPLLTGSAASATEALHATRTNAASATEGTTRQLAGGAVLHLAPGARMELGKLLKVQLGPPGSAETVAQVVKLISGRIDIEIPFSKIPKTAVLLEAPRKVNAVAKGGHSVAIVDTNRVTLAAIDGEMLAASGNRWKTLPSGLVRVFIGRDPAYQEHAVPGIPSLTISRPLLIALGDQAAKAQAKTGGVKDAEHYQLSVLRASDKSGELVRRVDTRGELAEIPGLLPGQYLVTARAVDAAGISGPDSAGRAVRVVGAELPVGSRYQDGAILLGTRGRVRLLNAAGLEASYGASTHFVSAPDTVGLSRGESTMLRLREPGTVDEVRVGLEPRTLRADVQITPKHPHWPADMIEVTVHLFDARGRAVSESVQVNAKVLIDVQPAEVTWLRSNNAMHAFIPAPTDRGPWVVRVEISDEFGDPAGRDFMEVAAPESDRVSVR